MCSVDLNACGPTGFKTRTRQILKDAANGGKPCEGTSMETEDCGGKPMEECKENCTLSAWMEVGRCSAVCGFGNQKYKRFVISEAKNGGTPCSSFALEETRTCFEEPCIPENCTLTGWAVDGPCSTTCGDGTQKYSRAIISYSKHGGIDCTDFALSETRPCNIKNCPRKHLYIIYQAIHYILT